MSAEEQPTAADDRFSDHPPAVLAVEPSEVGPDLLHGARAEILVVPRAACTTGPVVLGMAPWTGGRVVQAAAREAGSRSAELQVVRAWSDPEVDPGVVSQDVLWRWDEVDARLEADARSRLAPWWPEGDGPVRTLVVMDSAPETLALFTRTAQLLVIGHRTDADPAPLLALLQMVRCPVLIVPDGGPVGDHRGDVPRSGS